MKYPGESWIHQQARESLAQRDRQAEKRATAARRTAAARARRPTEAATVPPTPEQASVLSRPRWAWHGGDHPHDYRMTQENDR